MEKPWKLVTSRTCIVKTQFLTTPMVKIIISPKPVSGKENKCLLNV